MICFCISLDYCTIKYLYIYCSILHIYELFHGYSAVCPSGYEFFRKEGPCNACVKGKYNTGVAADAYCLSCSTPGKYAPNSSFPCIDCVKPYFQLDMPNTKYRCDTCAPGKRFNGIATECFGCATGQYTSASGDSCDKCGKGRATRGPTDTSCRECVPGYYQEKDVSTIDAEQAPNHPGQYLCATCPAGWGYRKIRQPCKQCDQGTYQNVTEILRIPNEKCNIKIGTIVDINIKNFVDQNLYLLIDKNIYFLADMELHQFDNKKVIVRPYHNSFSSFHINKEQLNIYGKALWQGYEV